ncbi:radical SAM protein [Candidatus Parcubacteria bacterium]|nr:radical SAM protein [Candidatus Parcubacteria bacterium]
MKRADIKLGFFCNNICKFCVQGDKRKKFGNKDIEQIKENIIQAKKTCNGVVFTGGEPTIRKDIIEIISFAKKSGFKVIQIQTNGRMFVYKSFCKELISAGVTEFSPALHGHTPSLHDYLTGAKGSFDQTVGGIKNLKDLNQLVITNTVITKSNYRHLPQIAQLLMNLKVDQYQFAFVHALGSAMKNFDSVVPRKSLVEPYVKSALDVGINCGMSVMTEAIPYCFMKGYEEYVAENIIPDTKIYDYEIVIDDFTKERISKGKSKGSVCSGCIKNNVCEGPWREYSDKYGWAEFKAIT